ncbi:hypothetical protein L226DRAFT_574135 [Lentinus tigrinus ALCF2SS1-7]|uniref:F-box domain-containing protein n=1 Tax=Lentinus tigrinus ALCF2SS1-6 TaxID=1328759 RepID=A0A5C2S075_9APHY|nr:hypothetical protein L227DRAFT_655893 [Lentinus tigrinus ALCF2SS1-6]RPD71124.1 hypothetical protein L226DRAFT_574135 [Lentinus tigrinus ALCF2SS1-7]
MPTPILPPELEDYILSFLRKDSRTLCACARVCKEWLPACRAYLFDNVSFKTPRSYTAFVEQVLGSLRMFAHLEMVHGIAIMSPGGFMNRYLADTFLRDMHGNLPNLRILRISHIDWSHLLTSHTYKLFDANATPPFPRLTKLAITHAVFPSERVLAQLLVSLPNLASLSLRHISFNFGTWDLSFPIRDRDSVPYRSTTLETLWVDGSADFATPFLAWFVEQFPEASLSLRKLGCTPTLWTPATAQMLDALRPTSALNTLLVPFPTDLRDLEPPSLLAHLKNLSRLNVVLIGKFPSSPCWSAFARMLDSLPRRPRLQGLSIALCYFPATPGDWACLDGPELEFLDPVLAKLASAIAPRPASLPMPPGNSDPQTDSTSDQKPGGVPVFKFLCYIQPPREGARIAKSDVDDLVRRKLKKAAECGVLVGGRLVRTLPGMEV